MSCMVILGSEFQICDLDSVMIKVCLLVCVCKVITEDWM